MPQTVTDLKLYRLNDALLAHIFSFSDASDFIKILETRNPILIKALQIALSNAHSLHFSFLLQLNCCRNHGSGRCPDSQETCTGAIFKTISRERAKLRRLEFSGLRHISGSHGDWLSRIFGQFSTTLTSIDFSGCALLDPQQLHQALVPRRSNVSDNVSSCSIRHLNFQGCYRIDSGIVKVIAKSFRFKLLEHLGLGGCSQSIGDDCVLLIVQNLKQLRSLDLSGLKHITDAASDAFQYLPETLENLELAGCELIRFSWLQNWGDALFQHLLSNEDHGRIDLGRLQSNIWREHHSDDKRNPAGFYNWIKVNLSGMGTPRRGLVEGALPYFTLRSMGRLREVYLSGCEQVQDWEIEILASVCASSLTCLEMRACCIGDGAIRAIGIHCTKIADLDFSACFRITDEGIISFCQNQGVYDNIWNKTRRALVNSTIRSLKIAALPQVTDESISAISALQSLLVLDVHNCPKITSAALAETLADLTCLVEIEAKGIGQWGSSASISKVVQRGDTSSRLRFINGRQCSGKLTYFGVCFVRTHSKRLLASQGVPLQQMLHCVDCKLVPALNRGVCYACSLRCHKGHRTFTGSYTRFYCDCPFGIASVECQAISIDSTCESPLINCA